MTNNIEAELISAREAITSLIALSEKQKNELLRIVADAVYSDRKKIAAANEIDLKNASGKGEAFCDRLKFDENRILDAVSGVKALMDLPDPIGKVLEKRKLKSGLKLNKIVVPIGVVAIVYEARPNVTIDAASIALKTSNVVVLRGSGDAKNTNKTVVGVMRAALKNFGVNENAITLIECGHSEVGEILTNDNIDLAIPRGSKKLIDFVRSTASVPVIETGAGNCSAYIDGTCDFELAKNVVLNAKTQRISVCNALESLYIERSAISKALPTLIALLNAGVTIHADEEIYNALKTKVNGNELSQKVVAATEQDYYKEYLALEISAKTVDDVTQAVAEINKYGTHHSDTILSNDKNAIDYFYKFVDSAVVYSNASTRFTDGGQFGFGCEIGISTQKLHARGPMGLNELTTYKYVVEGTGQVRE